MRVVTVIGIVLIVLGLFALTFQGITYMDRQAVIDAGPVHVDVKKERRIPLSPILGGTALAAGVILLLMGGRRIG